MTFVDLQDLSLAKLFRADPGQLIFRKGMEKEMLVIGMLEDNNRLVPVFVPLNGKEAFRHSLLDSFGPEIGVQVTATLAFKVNPLSFHLMEDAVPGDLVVGSNWKGIVVAGRWAHERHVAVIAGTARESVVSCFSDWQIALERGNRDDAILYQR